MIVIISKINIMDVQNNKYKQTIMNNGLVGFFVVENLFLFFVIFEKNLVHNNK
jgi:NADH:ubiquinone oxidoreductase subunit 4 (subunit M)